MGESLEFVRIRNVLQAPRQVFFFQNKMTARALYAIYSKEFENIYSQLGLFSPLKSNMGGSLVFSYLEIAF